MKRIRHEDADDPKWVEMFQREAKLVAMLRHQHIVGLQDFGEVDGKWWMSLELVDGADLRAVLAALSASDDRLPVPVVVHIATGIASALVAAHGLRVGREVPAGIVHRDISPPNILLSYAGAVKLTDFGIAKVVHSDRTRTASLKGKIPYMSPEQADQQPLDGRSDLFSLGSVLFEMLAGERAFQGKTDLMTQMLVGAARRRDLRDAAPGTPEVLVRIVDGLMQREREDRTPSAEALLHQLGAIPLPANVAQAMGGIVSRAAPALEVAAEGDLTQPE